VSANEDLGRTAEEVRQRILAQISAGQLRAGQKLGAERDLASEYQVSRSTLRIALTALEETGVVRRLPGRGGGTFVSPEKNRPRPFTDCWRAITAQRSRIYCWHSID